MKRANEAVISQNAAPKNTEPLRAQRLVCAIFNSREPDCHMREGLPPRGSGAIMTPK